MLLASNMPQLLMRTRQGNSCRFGVQIVVRHHGDHRGMVCCGRLCMGSCVDLLPLGMP